MKTKSLLKTFLTLLALTACLFMRPATATAQTMSVPYEPTFGETPPEGWITNNYNYETGIWGTGIAYLTPGLAVLPQFNQNLNTLELAISLKPNNSQNIQIGYVTNPNDASTFTALQTYDSWYNTTYTAYETKRIYFFYAPANARMAIRCNGSWYIGYLEVYAPAAESLPYTESFASHPSGWGVPSTMTLSDEVLQGSGTVVLPAFNQSIASAMIGAWIKPGNNTSSNSYLQIGYLTDPYNANTFTAFTDCTYNYRSSWTDFEYKTYNNLSIFDTYPNGRLALKCVGSWIIDYVEVYVPTSKTLPYGQEFSQPNSWVLPSTFIISNGILQGSGTIIFPAFNQSLASAVLDMLAKPGSGASDIYIGTVTNPNNPIFVSYGIIASSNSSWTDWKSASYSNLQFLNNSSARLAIKFNGNWMVDMVSLYEPFGLPYTPSLGSTKPGEWLSNNYHHLSSFPYTYLSTGYTVLPKFTVDLNTLQLQVDIGGYIVDGLGGIDFRIGYLTNPLNTSTFTVLKTVTTASGTIRVSFQNAPANARIAIYSNGNWSIRNFSVYTTNPMNVPYDATLPTSGQPEGWLADNYNYGQYYGGYLTTGCAVLPQFNANLNTLQLDISLAPFGSETQNISIGYVTDPNNPNTFTAIKTYTLWSYGVFQPKRVFYNVSGLPTNARMAIYSNGNWKIRNVHVEAVATYPVPYTASLNNTSLPEGWMTDYYFYSNGGAYLTSGCTILPQFSTSISSLQIDIALRPNNAYSQNISIGYVTNNNPSTFTAIQTFNPSSSWSDYQPKRILYTGVPSGARMAIFCNGDWGLGGVEVRTIQSNTTYDIPYHVNPANYLPGGWIVPNYNYSGGAYLSTGCAILPQFNATLNTLQLDIVVKPKNTNAQSIQVGYVTNNNASTFVALQTFSNSSSWGLYQPKRIQYNVNGLPSGARMALRCNGDWYINEVLVCSIPQPIAVPYSLPSSLHYNQPEGWMANNYVFNSTPRFMTGCALLPKFNVPINALNMHLSFRYENGNSPSLSVGYVTNDNPSTFTALWTHTQTWGGWQYYDVFLGGAPANARIAIRCEGTWTIDIVDITMPTLPVPYTQNFENVSIGSLPEGWIATNMSVQNGGTSYKRLEGTGYAMLTYFDDAELNSLQLDFRCRPSIPEYGGMIRVGYIPSGGNLTNFVSLTTLDFQTYWTTYRDMHVAFSNVPTGARLAFQCIAYGSGNGWMIDDVHIYPAETIPFTEPFATSSSPQGWTNYLGRLIEGSNNTHTATLTPYTYAWHFGEQNGVYDQHAYTLIGSNSNNYNWLVSPPIILGNANNVYLSFDLGMTRETGNQVPIIPGEQDSQCFYVLVSNDGGNTWHRRAGWCGEMTGLGDLNYIDPEEGNLQYSLSAYQNQTIQVAFYAECTDASDNCNHVHIDNVTIQSYDMTTPPVSVTVNDISGNSAKVRWTPAYPMQHEWDVCVCEFDLSTPPSNLIVHRQGYLYYDAQNLTVGTHYKAWVRYHSGNTISNWTCCDFMTTTPGGIPFDEPFDTNSAPDGWATYLGALNYNGNNVYTATLTPNTNFTWSFGEQNGVYDSHAYATLGNSSGNERRWLVSPLINFGNADNVFLSFDLGMTRATGNQVPITPGEQDHQFIAVLVTNDCGATWHALAGWSGEMTGWPDLNYLDPEDGTHYCSLDGYQNQNIQVAFYAECTNSGDATNHVHIDNVAIHSHDLSAPPVSVTVSEVAGHSAKVSWTPASPMQYHWDLWLPYYSDPNYINNCTPEYMQENGYYYQHLDGYLQHTVTGLEAGSHYRAWVRYNDGTTTSDWVASDVFNTESMCADPTNLQVEVTQHTALVTWDPGQSNQTSWYTYGGADDMDGETVYEPFRLLEGLQPGEEYEIQVTGYCEDDDGPSNLISTTFTTLPHTSLTVNDGGYTNEEVPITGDNCGLQMSRTQFIIPAEQLTDMQYSQVYSLTFDNQQYTNGQPWGEDADFDVYLKEVSQDDFSDEDFYDWDELNLVYAGSLSISGHLMTVTIDDYHRFHYSGGNLLVGFYQEEYDFTPGENFSHADWLGVDNYNSNPNYKPSIYYNRFQNEASAQTFSPKVTFTYETDTYLPPTNFVVTELLPEQVTLSWTPNEQQSSSEVELLNEYMDLIDNYTCPDDVLIIDQLDYPTTYFVRIRARYIVDGETYYSSWTNPVGFTTPNLCDAPQNLQANEVGPFTATLTWDSEGAYDELMYRAGQEADFESGVPEGWTAVKKDASSGGWFRSTYYHSGAYGLASICSNIGDDWLISPQVELGGTLTVWKTCSGSPTEFMVYVSTTGIDIDAGDFGDPVATVSATAGWNRAYVNLSAYSGMGYIAIRHHDLRGPSRTLNIDDLQYYAPWTSAGIVEGGQYVINDLTPGASYQAQVRTECEMGYMGYWSNNVSFSTPYNIVFEDDNVKDICVDNWDTNGDGELSYAEAAAVTTLNPSGATNSSVFKNNQAITYFNELQYFTGLTEIDNYAFAGCASLSAITLPSTITSIGEYAFGIVSYLGLSVPCSSLQSIVIPPSVTTIGAFAFTRSGLTEIDLPYSVTTIETLAFGECDNLVSVYLPATVTTINDNAFTGAALTNIDVDAGNPVFDSRNGCNAIIRTATNTLITGCKNTVVPYGVTAIGVSAFENCSNLTDITLPASVEMLGNYAFLNCSSLNTIEVEAITPPTMAEFTFGNLTSGNIKVYVPCGSLETYQDSDWNVFDLVENCNIVFEDNLTKELCVNAWDLNFDGELSYREAAAVTSLNNEFYESNITRFNELQYFTGLTSIGEEDFGDCEQLTAVTLPPTVTQIESYAFENCQSLTNITFGENIGTIHNYAFSTCQGLWFIKVEATTPPSLGEDAFYGAEIDIPVYVPCGTKTDYQNDSDWDIFEDYNIVDMCDTIQFADAAVRAICLDNWDTNNDGYLSYGEAAAVTSIGEVFSGNLSIQTFNELWYFTGLTEISDNAFMGCAWLSSIEMPPTIAHIGSLAFYNTQLNNMYIPYATQTIGWLAFGSCNSLTSFSIPPSVTYIEGNPFSNCPALNYIWVESGNPVYDARNNCKAIIETATNTLVTGCKNTVIPDDVTALGSYAFSGQTALTIITLPASITSLGNGVFENCTGLTEVNVQAETPPTMGYNVFDGVSDDLVINIPCGTKAAYSESWVPYAANLYDGCAYIEFADANVEAICASNWGSDGHITYAQAAAVTTLNTSGESNSSVFKGNQAITSFDELQYFTGLTSIEAYAFSGCRALTSITLPPAITSIGNYAFANCRVLTPFALPSTLTSIGSAAFGNCYALTAIDLPENLISIGGSAFQGCTSLTSIVIPASVTDIGTNPFRSCSALESITVDPENPKYDSRDGCNAIIHTRALGSTTLTNLISGCKNTVIPDGVTAINGYAFAGITELTSITLPGSLTTISYYAFQNCTGLQSITVLATTPPSLNASSPFDLVPTDIPVYVPCQSIEDYQAATGWDNFTNIQARTDVICFEDDAVKAICVAHWDSDGDGEVSYAEVAYVYTLGTYFYNNTTITSFNELQYFVRLSDLTAYAFYGCSALESVTLPEGVVNISSYAFNGCTSLTSITLPEMLTQIWDHAFMGCTSLESITIPNAVTTIGDHAFYGCTGLTDITIGESVSFMDQYVFGACANLQSITVMADNPPTLEYGVFYQVPKDIPVYVPCGSKAAYQAADGWSEFTNYIGEGCGQESILVNGWNWWAPTVETDLNDLEIGLGTNGLLINSQEGGFARYEVGGWWSGTLSEIEVGKMYKIETSSACTLSVQGDRPTTVTVTIVQGYNWFGYTGTQGTIAMALGNFEPTSGDKIISENGTATFNGSTWTGNFTELVPGHGYIYYSNSSTSKTVVMTQ